MEAERVDERVLIVTPTGRDADITREVLGGHGIACTPCTEVGELVREILAGAGAILIADEALTPDALEILATALERQEPWSEVPILVATTGAGSGALHERVRRHLPRTGSITVLERPIPTATLVTAVRSALSARRRQYEHRDLLGELRTNTQWLREERDVRERLVAFLAHDLRGPLSTLTYSVDLLAREFARPERRADLARRMARNLEQMDRMIRDLLDVHLAQAGQRLPLRLERCDLGALARDAADELRVVHGDRFVVRGETPTEGLWGAEALRRALWNLGTNAVKYGADDSPIEFVVGGGRDGACVSVHNEGAAIAREDRTALFRTFGSDRAPEAGMRSWGLGLALVQACAEAHGGTIEVESLPERGTTFTIRLPWDARPFQKPHAAPEPDRGDGRHAR